MSSLLTGGMLADVPPEELTGLVRETVADMFRVS
jgi:hypothetical protein